MEWRHSSRLAVRCSIAYLSTSSRTALAGEGTVINLSRAGLAIASSLPVPPGIELMCRVSLPDHPKPLFIPHMHVAGEKSACGRTVRGWAEVWRLTLCACGSAMLPGPRRRTTKKLLTPRAQRGEARVRDPLHDKPIEPSSVFVPHPGRCQAELSAL